MKVLLFSMPHCLGLEWVFSSCHTRPTASLPWIPMTTLMGW
jgi:hypothetical protein